MSTARYFARIRSTNDLEQLVHSTVFKSHRCLILGGGSNVLLATGEFEGIVLKNEITGIEIVTQDTTHATLRVGGGVIWTSLVAHCINNDLGGLENLSLIPGTVGATPIQNIGAYGTEIRHVLESVEVIDLSNGKTRVMSNAECQFGYRDSVFKHALKDAVFISAVVIKLSKAHITILDDQEIATIRSVGEAVSELRRRKLPDPVALGNAGSFFKNPVVDNELCRSIKHNHPTVSVFPRPDGSSVISAAWLIEKCGWKGKSTGRVGVYANHALILVNHDDAKGTDVLELARQITEDVSSQFGIRLDPEVNIARIC